MGLFNKLINRNHNEQAPSLEELKQHCQKLGTADFGDSRIFASLYSGMSLKYYSDVLSQAKNSFRFALAAAMAGVGFFIFAAWQMYEHDRRGWIGLIAGGLLQVISGTGFYLYGKASEQFGTFHICLDRANRFVLANTICEKLRDGLKDDTKAYLVRAITNAVLLTPDVVKGKAPKTHKPKSPGDVLKVKSKSPGDVQEATEKSRSAFAGLQ